MVGVPRGHGMSTNRSQENGAQVAVQTIYRELDRARTLIKKHAQDDDHTDEFEDEWTMVEDGEEVNAAPMEAQHAIAGMARDASQPGGGSLALGSMVLRGAQARGSEGKE